jgi:hypothetical protein
MASMLTEVQVAFLTSALWRFVRVFLSSFLVSASLLMVNVTQDDLLNWKRWAAAVIVAGMTGAVSAVGKFIRDEFGTGDNAVSKLPL